MTELTDQQIQKFAECMVDKPSYYKSNSDAGLTYFAQLIVHDIVPATNKDTATRNVTPALNLDSLYGDISFDTLKLQPESSIYFDCNGLFHVDDFDFKRVIKGEHYIAQTPEQRNDQNIIIAQLHVFWLRFHNYLLEKKLVDDALEARKIVTLVFQLIVIEDFLLDLLKPEVFEHCFRDNLDYVIEGFDTAIPDFFSKASFRFGHSMPRNFYELQESPSFVFKPIPLTQLFRPRQRIKPTMAIDWQMFFSQPSENNYAQKGFAIDSGITELVVDNVVNSGGTINEVNVAEHIVTLNLRADRNAKLNSGHDIAVKIIEHLPSHFDKPIELITNKQLTDSRFREVANGVKEFPLWPYILLEAELQSKKSPEGHGGRYLGGLGSVLNASVLKKAMMVSQFSVFQNGKYDFESVVKRLGKFGDELPDREQGSKPLSMSSVIDLIKGVTCNE